ncbi:DUF6777 domain-containing protein [Streptomyces sp. NEAU-NA10]|uniref:DUF6777 domain-containing protein n=1 Tax=Streptomyces sp. NEAU-NA10 TaxID=3416050 RepID=UPI003CC539ED
MSAEPPSSGRPTGPPSGPLSGSSPPPTGPPGSVPPEGPPDGPFPGGPSEPSRRWWKSAPRIAMITIAVVVAVALAVVLTRPDGGGSGRRSEVFLQAAGKTGPDPFTPSTATTGSAPPTSTATATTSESANVLRGVNGGAGGLYGGTRDVAACDVEKQIEFLQEAPAKNDAFASVVGVAPSQVPAYLRSLTPVQLRMDTRVTNHGYRDGAATAYQAVLQAGTAVLVDGHGLPRVRCACGNPLTPPVAQPTAPTPTGDSWPSYRPSNVVVVTPSTTLVKVFVLHDSHDDGWIARQRGDTDCDKDRPAKPPANPPRPSPSASLPSSPTSPSGKPSPSVPPTSRSTESPTPAEPSSPSPKPEPPSPEPSSPPPPPPTSPPETEAPSPPEAPPTNDTVTQSAPSSAPEAPSGPPSL